MRGASVGFLETEMKKVYAFCGLLLQASIGFAQQEISLKKPQ
jgi:hypothetical protein